AYIKNIKKISDNQYDVDLQLDSSKLGENDQIVTIQSLRMKETCKSGDFRSVLYERSNISKLMQFLFFRH
ncbi:MAG: hypothetical protein RSA09_14420, partial [Acinetobacter sp.]